MQSGNMIVKRETLNLKDKINEVENLLQDMFKSKRINFINKVDSDIEVKADSNMVSTVLRNIISNAVKFTFKGGNVGIKAKQSNNVIEVCVYDTGVGISDDNLEKLFDDETHIHTYGTKEEKGSGLGLKLCKDFVEANEGKIWAESELNKGCKIIFTLQSA